MKLEFEVVVDGDRLDASAMGSVTGPLAVRLGGRWFPDRGWSDFPVIVLSWWLRQCRAMETGGNGRLRFMDGPFELVVYPGPGGWADVELQELHGGEPTIVSQEKALTGQVVDMVRAAARDILASCKRRRWHGTDIDQLALLLGEPPNDEMQRTRPAPTKEPRR